MDPICNDFIYGACLGELLPHDFYKWYWNVCLNKHIIIMIDKENCILELYKDENKRKK